MRFATGSIRYRAQGAVRRVRVRCDQPLQKLCLKLSLRAPLSEQRFLAVFTAGLSVRRIERQHSEVAAPPDVEQAAGSSEEQATDPYGPCLHGSCSPRLQRATGALGELVVVVVLGAMLTEVEVVEQASGWR
jgi:hypothetical protein